MGWWTREKNGNSLDMGDTPLDAVHTALKKVARSYKHDLKRKPTLAELTELLESSIRIFEEDLFDDMDERELDSVDIQLRARPKRPRPKSGDFFAIPLPSGGYAYGRVVKITNRVLLRMWLLGVSSESVLPLDRIKDAKVLIDIKTRTSEIDNVEWPIVGHVPLSAEEETVLANEPRWITNYTIRGVEKIAEWKLAGKPGLPPYTSTPYEGYKG
jgi:hypothetical protein